MTDRLYCDCEKDSILYDKSAKYCFTCDTLQFDGTKWKRVQAQEQEPWPLTGTDAEKLKQYMGLTQKVMDADKKRIEELEAIVPELVEALDSALWCIKMELESLDDSECKYDLLTKARALLAQEATDAE